MRLLSNLTEKELVGKRVLLRADLDVEIDESGNVLEDFRLRAMQPTFEFLLTNGVDQIIIAGHLGRPEGKVVEKERLEGVSNKLSELLGQSIKKLDEVTPAKIPNDKIVMLENLRFDPGEEANDPAFAEKLAGYANLYVNECFADSHRNHASISGIPQFLPSYAGLRLAGEVATLSNVLENPERPLVVIIGGAKLETKEPVIKNLEPIADKILVGGKVGFDPSFVGAYPVSPTAKVLCPVDGVTDNKDIGPETIKQFVTVIKTAKTIIWNGPLGMFEDEEYAVSTKAIAGAVVNSAAKTIVGGGDTVAALQKLGLLDKIGFVSTGGGAMLEFLAGNILPGIAAL